MRWRFPLCSVGSGRKVRWQRSVTFSRDRGHSQFVPQPIEDCLDQIVNQLYPIHQSSLYDVAARCCLVVEPVAVVQAAVGVGSAVAVAAVGVVGDGVERAGLGNDGLLDEAERSGLVGVVADGVGIGLALGDVDGAGRVGNILALGGVVEGLHGVIGEAAGSVVDGMGLVDDRGHDGLLVDDGLLVHHGLVGVGGDGILVEHLGVGLGLALGDVDGAGALGMILALGGVVLGLHGVVGVG